MSLAGSLSFAAKVIPAGRTFCRRLFDRATELPSLDTQTAVPDSARLDIMWWKVCLKEWNGRKPLIAPSRTTAEDIGFYTDASGLIGFGLVFGNEWSHGTWSSSQVPHSIEWKELYAVVLALCTWAPQLKHRRVLLYTDNEAICYIWRTGTSSSKAIMDLVRAGLLLAAHHNIIILLCHIAGHNNTLADSLSRSQVRRFQSLHPDAAEAPTLAAQSTLQELMTEPWSSSIKAWQQFPGNVRFRLAIVREVCCAKAVLPVPRERARSDQLFKLEVCNGISWQLPQAVHPSSATQTCATRPRPHPLCIRPCQAALPGCMPQSTKVSPCQRCRHSRRSLQRAALLASLDAHSARPRNALERPDARVPWPTESQ